MPKYFYIFWSRQLTVSHCWEFIRAANGASSKARMMRAWFMVEVTE